MLCKQCNGILRYLGKNPLGACLMKLVHYTTKVGIIEFRRINGFTQYQPGIQIMEGFFEPVQRCPYSNGFIFCQILHATLGYTLYIGFPVFGGYLVIEGPKIIKHPESENPAGDKVNNTGNPFIHIHPMDAEEP